MERSWRDSRTGFGCHASAAPAPELVDLRLNIDTNLPLGVARGVAQGGGGQALEVRPYPAEVDIGAMTAEIRRNSEVAASVRGKDPIDDQLRTVAWLANPLAQFDLAVEVDECTMTGWPDR